VRDFITGVRYFLRGFGLLIRRPRLLVLGMLPAVLTTLIFLGAMIALIANAPHLATLATPFANGWPTGARQFIRLAAAIVMIGAAAVLGVVAFTGTTLAIGGPFYERIAARIEDDLGVTAAPVEMSWGREFATGARDGVVLFTRSVIFGIPIFAAGFLPVVGQSVVPALAAAETGWFMALEVVGVPFYRRGIGLRRRTAMLRQRRMLAVGLGLPAALLCMIPLLAIVVMPVAFAGGVLVALDVLGSPDLSPVPGRRSAPRPPAAGRR
jgi:CysZ protein